MIIMAENDSGVMFMSEAAKSLNGTTITLDSAMTSDEVDSEAENVAMTAKSYMSSAETKRNKRKNFQPRNIAYSETESVTGSFSNRDRTPSNSDESDFALDLSNSDVIRNSCADESMKSTKDEAIANPKDETVNESSPIDLSCSKNTSPYPYNHVNSYYSDSDSEDVIKPEERRRKDILDSLKPPGPPYFLHPFLGHGIDASELKDVFKDFLEIYGLNSDTTVADVAQTIANNVPISNFPSGKYMRDFFYPPFGTIII